MRTHACAHTPAHTRMARARAHTCTHACTHTRLHAHASTGVLAYADTRLHTSTRTRMCTCTHRQSENRRQGYKHSKSTQSQRAGSGTSGRPTRLGQLVVMLFENTFQVLGELCSPARLATATAVQPAPCISRAQHTCEVNGLAPGRATCTQCTYTRSSSHTHPPTRSLTRAQWGARTGARRSGQDQRGSPHRLRSLRSARARSSALTRDGIRMRVSA